VKRGHHQKITAVGVLLASAIFATLALAAVPVTIDNFARAESDLYFGNAVKEAGGVGKFFHNRTPTEIGKRLSRQCVRAAARLRPGRA
jgi:hypothetical protein